MSVQVDAAADLEPETAGRRERKISSATVPLVRDGRQAPACWLGFDLKKASRARLAVCRADERCAQAGPPWVERPRALTTTIARLAAWMRHTCCTRQHPPTATHAAAQPCDSQHSAARRTHAATTKQDAHDGAQGNVTGRSAERGRCSLGACNGRSLYRSMLGYVYMPS